MMGPEANWTACRLVRARHAFEVVVVLLPRYPRRWSETRKLGDDESGEQENVRFVPLWLELAGQGAFGGTKDGAQARRMSTVGLTLAAA
ncbi:hypothetical protein WJ62_21125 [Burkholderia diffusa]|nr:hypothetical protein WJ62_21125 [Burkholderia diffusa]